MFRLLALLFALLFPAGGDDDPEPDTEPVDDPDPADDPADDPEPGGDNPPLDAEAMAKELEKARKQAAKYRTERNSERQRIQSLEDQNKAILQALGISSEEDDDPEARVAELQRENRRLRARQSFDVAAREAGADEDLTWGYFLARGEIDALDPDSDDFAETLQASISAALEAKPGLASTPPPPPKGGADLDDDGNPDATPEDELPMKEYMERRAERRGSTKE